MKKQQRTVRAADLFCGAGGTSSGLVHACKKLGLKLDLVAVNHWPIAISTHQANHRYAKHVCQEVDDVDPRRLVPKGRLQLLWASPECVYHSNARGGKPIPDQGRASAWAILRWAEAIYIENIIIENVPEFRYWGPLGANGKPLRSRRGETYLAFLHALRSLGYNVESRVLNAANYGDPTTRERLFIIARRGKKIAWPEPTHGNDPLYGKLKPWRAAREIIDWSIPGKSIFDRKRPLKPATLARIEAGLRKFGGIHAEPFIVVLRNHADVRSVDEPVPTLTANGQHIGVCEPFVLGQQSGAAPRSTGKPLPTIATDGAIGLVEPFIIPQFSEAAPRSVDKPLGTITTTSRGIGLCEPFLATVNHGDEGESSRARRTHSVDGPVPTLTTNPSLGLVEPFLVPFFGEREGQAPRTHSVDDPLPTVTSHGAGGLVEPFIMPVNHGKDDNRAYSLENPMPTVTTLDAWSMVEPFLTKYYGTAKTQSVKEPLHTVTAKDRFGLVETVQGKMRVDIRFRMLKPHELAKAMSFDDDYKFTGNREQQVKQIGNAVAVRTAQALCEAVLRS